MRPTFKLRHVSFFFCAPIHFSTRSFIILESCINFSSKNTQPRKKKSFTFFFTLMFQMNGRKNEVELNLLSTHTNKHTHIYINIPSNKFMLELPSGKSKQIFYPQVSHKVVCIYIFFC
jgi:hypothetical protein